MTKRPWLRSPFYWFCVLGMAVIVAGIVALGTGSISGGLGMFALFAVGNVVVDLMRNGDRS